MNNKYNYLHLILGIAVSVIMIILSACGELSAPEEKTITLLVKDYYSDGDTFIVTPVEDTDNLKATDEMYIEKIAELLTPGEPLCAGDTIEITYSGIRNESMGKVFDNITTLKITEKSNTETFPDRIILLSHSLTGNEDGTYEIEMDSVKYQYKYRLVLKGYSHSPNYDFAVYIAYSNDENLTFEELFWSMCSSRMSDRVFPDRATDIAMTYYNN